MNFTDRETQIITLMICGLVNKEIARKLNIDVKTVEAHSQNIYKKLEVKSKNDLLCKFIDHILGQYKTVTNFVKELAFLDLSERLINKILSDNGFAESHYLGSALEARKILKEIGEL